VNVLLLIIFFIIFIIFRDRTTEFSWMSGGSRSRENSSSYIGGFCSTTWKR